MSSSEVINWLSTAPYDQLQTLKVHLSEWLVSHGSLLLKYPEKLVNALVERPDTLFFDALNALFNPKLVVSQLAALIVLQSALAASFRVGKFTKRVFKYLFSDRERRRIFLANSMETCSSYEEWKELAGELDALNGLKKWRSDPSCEFYDVNSIQQRIEDTKELINKKDVFELMFRMRGGLARNQFGIQNERLFNKCKAGTKELVHEYHNTIKDALDFICDYSEDKSTLSSPSKPTATANNNNNSDAHIGYNMESTPSKTHIQEQQQKQHNIRDQIKLAFFNETRYAFGRTAILLSGGASLGYYHLGVIYALFKANLLPRIISGSSAGSIMAAVVGTKTSDEYLTVLDRMRGANSPESECESDEPFGRCFFRFSTELKSPVGQWIQSHTPNCLKWLGDPLLSLIFDGKVMNVDSQHFRRKIRELIGTLTFQEAFDKTSKIINITVAPVSDYDSPRLLNYLTAPHVCVWSAVVSSCSIPGVFDSSPLVVKTSSGAFEIENVWTRSTLRNLEQQNYSDGSLETDLPMKQLSELFNVNHFIVSQVNPHSLVLSSISGTKELDVWSDPVTGFLNSYIQYLRNQCKYWCKSVMEFCGDFLSGTRKGFVSGALLQEYEGGSSDITIFPWKEHRSLSSVLFNLIRNPGRQEFEETLRVGEAAVWSHLERIRANCHVELTLDRCVNKLRRRIADRSLDNTANAGTFAGVGGGSVPRVLMERRDSFVLNPSALTVSDPIRVDECEDDDDDDVHNDDDVDYSANKGVKQEYDTTIETNNSSYDGSSNEDDESVGESGKHAPISSPTGRRNSSNSSQMKKSTNMANFYYRRSSSSENLSQSGWQGL